ncbi:MAG: DEAD/DEAH box helicase [Pseudomonadales bacterium]|nr:DEAD/DEAH box helicase [Pseudomonadales bacterium]
MSESETQQTEENKAVEESGVKFADLALSAEVQQAVAAIGYEKPSPIQEQAIPFLLEGRDVLGVAQTGTGKTAAFALPFLTKIMAEGGIKNKKPQLLCLAPTRELAIQVAEAFQSYAKFIKGFQVLPIYGGADYRGQIRQLERGVQVVVGTPGRVMDHIRKGTLKLDNIHSMVLDEADEMLRMGFIDDVEWILEQMPEGYQTALFSATMPKQIRSITTKYLNNPAEVTIKVKTQTASTITQRYVQLRNNEKLDILTRIMEVEEFDAMIIFVRTKNATLEVAEKLQARGYAAEALNGDIAQSQREKVIQRLKGGGIDIVVATDVAARGLDVTRISHVINYDVPYDTESYVHRIGRTGRAGRTGDAILFVNGREKRMLQAIERATRQKIERFQFPSLDVLNERKTELLFDKITTELQKDLGEYMAVMTKFMVQNQELDPMLLASAMASLQADSKPFYIKEQARSRPERDDRSNERSERFDRDRNNRGDRGERGDKRRSGRSEDINFETYKLQVGEEHGVGKGDIVGAIANEAGIESKYMGKIRIFEKHSFIDLPEGMPSDLLKQLKDVFVRGQKLNLSKDDSRKGGYSSERSDKRGDNRSDRGDRGDKRSSNRSKPEGNRERSDRPAKPRLRKPRD